MAFGLYQLHLVGWVHKSIRSDNIVFFPLKISNPPTNDIQTASASSRPGTVSDSLSDRRTRKNYDQPWLFGFDFASVGSSHSDMVSTDSSIEKNIYRHPARWNSPTRRFGPIDDIYALGTVLLEIGLWKPLISLSSTRFSRAARDVAVDDTSAAMAVKEGVRVQLLQYATERLPYTLGRNYCGVVELCLSGKHRTEGSSLGFNVDDGDEQGLQKSFREKVFEPLAKILANI